MKKIVFLADYRGVLTEEIFYPKGAEVEMVNAAADALIDAGRVSEVKPSPPKKSAASAAKETKK